MFKVICRKEYIYPPFEASFPQCIRPPFYVTPTNSARVFSTTSQS